MSPVIHGENPNPNKPNKIFLCRYNEFIELTELLDVKLGAMPSSLLRCCITAGCRAIAHSHIICCLVVFICAAHVRQTDLR